MRTLAMIVFAAVALAGSALAGPSVPTERSCGVASLIALCALLDRNLESSQLEALNRQADEPDISMKGIVDLAASVGVDLEGYRATIHELTAEQRPAIVHLKDPDHFLVVAGGTSQVLQVFDGGTSTVVPRSEIERRFSGRALLPRQFRVPGPRALVTPVDQLITLTGWQRTVAYEVSISNTGVNTLTTGIDSKSCDCVLLEDPKREIDPGGSATIRVSVDRPQNGVTQWLSFKTNDPNRPIIVASLRSFIPLAVTVSPERLSLVLDRGKGAERELRVVGNTALAVSAQGSAATRFLSVGCERVADDSRAASCTWVVRLRFASDAPIGRFSDVISITTNDARRPLLTVPVDLTVLGDLRVTPSECFIGIVRSREKATRSISLDSRSGRTFHVREVRTSGPQIRASWARQSRSVLDVEVKADEAGSVDGWIEILTDVPGQEKIRVPVSGLVE